jgi:hypothetical protein
MNAEKQRLARNLVVDNYLLDAMHTGEEALEQIVGVSAYDDCLFAQDISGIEFVGCSGGQNWYEPTKAELRKRLLEAYRRVEQLNKQLESA